MPVPSGQSFELSEADARDRVRRIDAVMAEFDREMTELRLRQKDLLKRVLARIDAEKRDEIKRGLN